MTSDHSSDSDDASSTQTTGSDDVAIDPWGSDAVTDYPTLFEEFGIEPFEDVLQETPGPHFLMRRNVIFGHRDYLPITAAIQTGSPFAVLSGFMPSGEPHIGHKLVFDELIWHQDRGGDATALIADLEAHSARALSWETIDKHAKQYLVSLLAFGFDAEEGTLYRQSENRTVQDLAFELGVETNLSELESIYGFDGETDPSHVQSVLTQMADILSPQLEEPKPTVIPVGPDQDPHIRLVRDLAARMRFFIVTEAFASFEAEEAEQPLIAEAYEELHTDASEEPVRCESAAEYLDETYDATDTLEGALEKLRAAGNEPLRPRVRFLDRNANDEAVETLIEEIEGEKRVYEEHVDAFDMSAWEAESLARDVEVECGGHGFIAPSSIYHRFMTGLTGTKMSSSDPASHISLLDDPEDGYETVKAATTGGRETAEKQRELGGDAENCPVYELYAYLLAGDDDEFAEAVYEECVGGERLCGGCKEQAAELTAEFLADHQEKRADARERLEELDIEWTVS